MKERHKKESLKLPSPKPITWLKEIYLTTSLSFVIGLLLILQMGNLSQVPQLRSLGQVVIITSSLMALTVSLGKFGNEKRIRIMNKALFWFGVALLIVILGAIFL